MDEKIKEITERLARAERFAEQLQVEQDCRCLLSHIKKLETQLHKAACDISFWREQRHDACKSVKELEEGIEKFKQQWNEEPDSYYQDLVDELFKLVEKE